MKINFTGNTKINVLYFNDAHSNIENQKHLKTGVDVFDKNYKGQANLKLAGGDLLMRLTLDVNEFILKVMDEIGLDASSAGNHDIEGGDDFFKTLAKIKPKFKFLAANLKFKEKHKYDDILLPSKIIKKNGEKIGLIGLSAFNFHEVNFIDDRNDYFNVEKLEKSIESVKKEVAKLEKQGVNKIFLLAHTGYESEDGDKKYYKELSKISGVDVIIGGHDHTEYDKWCETQSHEPVKIVSCGKASDKNIKGMGLDSFGVLNATFDDKGVLVKDETMNNFHITKSYKPDMKILEMEKEILKGDKTILRLKKPLQTGLRVKEDLIGDLWADSMRWFVKKELGKEAPKFGFVNSGGIKCDIPNGKLKESILKQAIPYNPRIVVTTLTQKQLIDTLNWGIKSTMFKKPEPGILQVSGLKYTIGKNNKAKDVCILNDDGSVFERIDTAPQDKEYPVIYDEFLVSGPAGFVDLKKEKSEFHMFDKGSRDTIIQFLKENKPDYSKGRITKEV